MLKRIESGDLSRYCTSTFRAVLFTVAIRWEHFRCSSAGEWISKTWINKMQHDGSSNNVIFLTSLHYDVDEMREELNPCLYQLACGQKSQNLSMMLNDNLLYIYIYGHYLVLKGRKFFRRIMLSEVS